MGLLLLLHGARFDQRQFPSLFTLLGDTFDVMFAFLIEEFAEQVVSFLNQQCIDKAHFYGFIHIR
ncbi:MAG: hypothetical protein U0Z75_06745 [Deinococcaceae bacterium]